MIASLIAYGMAFICLALLVISMNVCVELKRANQDGWYGIIGVFSLLFFGFCAWGFAFLAGLS